MFRSSRDGGGASCFMWKLMMSIGVLALLERQLPGQHLVRHHAERVDVGPPVELLAAQLLRAT